MKKFLIIFGSLVAIIAIAICVFLMTFDINRYRSDIVVRLSSLLGRPVQVGQMTMKLAAVPTVKIGSVKIMDNENDTAFMDIDNAEITLALAPLLSKRLEIKDITLGHVVLNLIQRNGHGNWQLSSKNESVNQNNQVWLANTQIESLTAKMMDVNYQGRISMSVPMMEVSVKHLKIFTAQVVHNGNVFQLSGTLNDLLDLMRHTPDYAFNLDIDGADMGIKVSGVIGDTIQFKKWLVNASIHGKNLQASLEKMGLTGALYPMGSFTATTVIQGDPDLMEIKEFKADIDTNKINATLTGTLTDEADGYKLDTTGTVVLSDWALAQMWGLRPMTAEAGVSITKTGIDITHLILQAGRSGANITGRVLWGNKPQINMAVSSDYLNLRDMILGDTTYAATQTEEQKIQMALNRRLNWDWMKQADSQVKVILPHLQITDDLMMGVYGVAGLKDGVLSMPGIQMTLLNGEAKADMMINANTSEAALKIQGKGMSLNAVGGLEYVVKDALIDGEADLNAKGRTLGEMMATMNGTVKAELYKGRIISAGFSNLADVLFNENKHSITYTTADRESEILCGAVDVAIQNGQINANRVALETSRMNLLVKGIVNLGAKVIDVMLSPSSPKLIGAEVPEIKLTGSLLAPKVELTDAPETVGEATYTPYASCAEILGHSPKLQQEEIAKSQQMLPLPQVQEETQPVGDSFQDQLMEQLRSRK